MCTLTWFLKSDGYELFFNRDERLSRKQALLPSLKNLGGISYIAPIDADAGGTWIASNEHGLSVCLLNYYQFESTNVDTHWTSRGKIVIHFASFKDIAAAKRGFKELPLEDYRAFRLFVIDIKGNTILFVWDGKNHRIETEVKQPKTSSSVDTDNVKKSRKQLYADLNLSKSSSREDYIAYHTSHIPSRSKYSVNMLREDAKTVSFSHINVTDNKVSFTYADGSPCETPLEEPLYLDIKH